MAFDTNSLADALMSATVEQLREDARFAAEFMLLADYALHAKDSGAFYRLAALALAVADWQERIDRAHATDDDPPEDTRIEFDGGMEFYWGDKRTLPAALAALVREHV